MKYLLAILISVPAAVGIQIAFGLSAITGGLLGISLGAIGACIAHITLER